MRLPAFIFGIVLAAPAAAQEWKNFGDPVYSFEVAFPGEPKIESTTFEAADGRQVGARLYSVTSEHGAFRLTIAELPDRAAQKEAEVDHAAKALARGGTVMLDIPHRISAVYGRQLTVAGEDGSYSSIALFYYRRRLYQIEGKVLPGGDNATVDAVRFQQSLVFTEDDD
jgi:hypothetical protein